MTRFVAISAAALALAMAATSGSIAQIGSPGTGSPGTGSPGVGAPAGTAGSGVRTPSTGLSSTTSAPQVLPAQPVPQPAIEPNNQVAPSARELPGGGTQTPLTPGSQIGTAVPMFGTQDTSGIGGSINESAQRSSDTDCTGTGTRSSTGSGSTSTVTANCAPGGLGTQSIVGSGGAIDVTGR